MSRVLARSKGSLAYSFKRHAITAMCQACSASSSCRLYPVRWVCRNMVFFLVQLQDEPQLFRKKRSSILLSRLPFQFLHRHSRVTPLVFLEYHPAPHGDGLVRAAVEAGQALDAVLPHDGRFSPIVMFCCGHSRTHSPHFLHRSGSTWMHMYQSPMAWPMGLSNRLAMRDPVSRL